MISIKDQSKASKSLRATGKVTSIGEETKNCLGCMPDKGEGELLTLNTS